MSKDSFGLRISVTLDDDMARQKLEELKKGFEVPLGFDTKEIANSIAQMKQIKELEITSIVQDEALKSLEKMNEQLTLQTELLTKISALNKTEPKTKEENYLKEVLDIQKKIFSYKQKQIGLTQSEQLVIDKRIGKLYDELDVKKSLITDAKQLNKIEEERKKLQDDLIMNQKLYETKQANIASTEEARKTAKIKKSEEVNAYRELESNIRRIGELEIKSLNATKDVADEIERQIDELKDKNALIREELELTNNINEIKEKKIASVEEQVMDKVLLARVAHEQKLDDLADERLKKTDEESAKTEKLVEFEKDRLNLVIKNLENGRNGEFLDETKLNQIKHKILELNGATTAEVREQVKRLNLEIRELASDANIKRVKNTKTLLGSLSTTFKNLTAYVSGAMLIRQFWNGLREGIQTVKELDDAITTLRITMEKFTDREINTLIKKSQELSKTLKANINDVLTTVKTVANENETMESIMAKTTPSVILSNLTGLGTDQTVEMIQGAMQQFKELEDQSAESAMKVADSMVAISKSLSMDFSKGVVGMSEGVEILGSLADQVEMDLDTVLSVMSATAEKTRLSYSEIANALKTTISRTMRVADPSGEVSEADMLKTEKALNSVGIAIRNLQTGEMRPFMDVITDLSDKWGDLTEAQQSYVAVIATAIVQQ